MAFAFACLRVPWSFLFYWISNHFERSHFLGKYPVYPRLLLDACWIFKFWWEDKKPAVTHVRRKAACFPALNLVSQENSHPQLLHFTRIRRIIAIK